MIDGIDTNDYKDLKKAECTKKIAYMKNINSSKGATMRSNCEKNGWSDAW